MSEIFSDIRYSLRSLWRSPGFTLAVVLTLGIGIGANTAVFNVVNGVLLRDLPFEEPDRLVRIIGFFRGRTSATLSEANFRDFQDQISSVESIGAYAYERWHLRDENEPRRILVARTSAGLIPTLGVHPLLGRTFTAEDDTLEAEPVVVLTHRLWQSNFGGRSGVLGEELDLDGTPYTVIGVMPAGFTFPWTEVEAYVPLRLDPANPYARVNHYLRMVGRLREGSTLEEAQAELSAYGERAAEEFPENYATFDFGTSAVGLMQDQVGSARTPLLVLLAAVGFVLLIACANVANLILVRAEARSDTIAVRIALGASRARIVSQLLVDSLVLSVVGGLTGLLVAVWGGPALLALATGAVPRLEEISMDGRVLGFTATIAVLSGLLAGLLPALRMASSRSRGVLPRSGGRSVLDGRGSRRGRGRQLLIVGEVALAVVLVVGAGVMVRSLGELVRLDVGFRTDDILTLRLALPEHEYTEPAQVVAFHREMIERVEAMPGVARAGIASALPLATEIGRTSLQIGGQIVETIGEAPVAQIQRTSPGYLEALGFELKAGRLLADTDVAGQPYVAVVNETFAERLLGGDALGRRVRMFAFDSPMMEIVGVVGDVLADGLLQTEPWPRLYVHYAQAAQSAYSTPSDVYLVVRVGGQEAGVMGQTGRVPGAVGDESRLAGEEPGLAGEAAEAAGVAAGLVSSPAVDPLALAEPIRRQIRAIEPAAAIWDVATMAEVRRTAAAAQEFPTVLLGVFGMVAVLLAAIGIFGMVSYRVGRRTPEIGLRMALGARGADVRRMVVGQAILPVAAGLLVGITAAMYTTELLASLLFGVSPLDPITYVSVVAILAAVALLASYLPARRATRVEPSEVLRGE
jgi:predicted permease